MISQRARYAFKALIALEKAGAKGLQIKELAAKENIPRKFLEQILLSMKTAGLIASRRGRDGGYEVLKPPSQISIGQLLRVIDGPIAPLPCLSRTAYRRCNDCRDESTCELRRAFAKAYDNYLSTLEKTSVADAMMASGGQGARESGVVELVTG